MLKNRTFTLLILVLPLLLVIRYLPMPWFGFLIGIVVLLAAWEWSALAKIKNYYFRNLYLIAILLAIIGAYYYLSIFLVLIISFAFWLWAAVAVICYAKGLPPLGFQYNITKIVTGFFVLTPFWVTGVALRGISGSSWLLFGLLLVWTLDIGSYTIGRWYGSRTLIARVSPNKTWEGLWGGIILALMTSVAISLVFSQPLFQLILTNLLALFVAIFAIIGDLFESMLKRQAGIKDTGHLLPGHGGILDRIDSILAALPIFLLGSWWICPI